MKPGPNAVVSKILTDLELQAPPLDVVEVTTSIIVEQKWCNEEDARERAESWRLRILGKLQQELNVLQTLGRPPRVAFNSSSSYMIQGACFVERGDSAELAALKAQRAQLPDYQGLLQKLKPVEFERLCGKLIGLLGVQNPRVTRSSADEGIDFYGILSLESIFYPRDLTPTIQKQLSIWIVGQAKRYEQIQAGTAEVRALVGSIALGRAQVFGSVSSPLADLMIRPADPVFAILATTGSFSRNAWRLLQRSGVVGYDGEMLAAFLAAREAGFKAGSLDEATFLKWLEEQ